MNFKLDKNSRIPFHYQIEEYLRTLIKKQEYYSGENFLPKEVSMSKKLGVSRSTIRQATSRLVHEGLIERKKGIGSKVVPLKKISSRPENWISFIEEMKRKGINVITSMVNLSLVNAEKTVYKALGIDDKIKLWKLEKVQGVKGIKILYTVSYFHPRVELTGEENMTLPLYELLENSYNIIVNTSKEKIFAVKGSKEILTLLEVNQDMPLLKRERLVLDIGDKPIQYNLIYYRSDSFSFNIDIQKE